MKITVENDGVVTDITEGVQILYDAMVATMDWTSGLLDRHEVLATWNLARACGFDLEAYHNFPCDTCLHPAYHHAAHFVAWDGHPYTAKDAP
mgnify:CR=1 FL=1